MPSKLAVNFGKNFQFYHFLSRFPVEIFLSIVEYEASLLDLQPNSDHLSYMTLATDGIDLPSLSKSDLKRLSVLQTWPEFKSAMIQMYGFKSHDQLDLIKSLVKGVSEDARHFLIRCQHFARLMDSCSCTQAETSVNGWTRLLFLMGLQGGSRLKLDDSSIRNWVAWHLTEMRGYFFSSKSDYFWQLT